MAAGWAWSEGKGIQVILDMVGGHYSANTSNCLRSADD